MDEHPIPVTYKHLVAGVADIWMGGSVRLRPLSYYRDLENAAVGVSDDLEGHVESHIMDHMQLPGGDPVIRDRMARHGLYQGPNASSWNVGVRIRSHIPDCYILCLTREGVPGLFGEEYEAVIRIPNFVELGRAITTAGLEFLREDSIAGEVVYDNCDVDLSKSEPLPPSVFRKRPKYAAQKEIRLRWHPRGIIREFVDVQSDMIAQLLDRIV